MFVKFRIGHRPDPSEEFEAAHRRVMETLTEIGELWRERPPKKPLIEIAGGSAATDLTPAFRDGLRGAIHYAPRDASHSEDKALFDDTLVVELDTEQVDYRQFVHDVLPLLIVATRAYRGLAVLHRDLERRDHPAIVEMCERTGKDVNGRDGIFRLSTVTYADRELCHRAFRRSPEDIVERLADKVEEVRTLGDGVLIVYSYALLAVDEFGKVDGAVRALLS